MEWKGKSESITGKTNRDRNVVCQDRIYYTHHEELYCIALADGASCSEYAGLGAEVSVETVCEIMREKFDYLFELDEERIKYDVLCTVLRKLRKIIINTDIKLKDLASTLLFTAVKGDRYMSMLLGDGIIVKSQKEHYGCLIRSETKSTNKKKHLTSSPMCYLNAYVNKGNVGDIDSFFMCSDGFSDIVNINDLGKLKNSIENVIEKGITYYVDKEADCNKINNNISADDCTYITLYKNHNR